MPKLGLSRSPALQYGPTWLWDYLIIIYSNVYFIYIYYVVDSNLLWITGTKLGKGKVSFSHFEILINGGKRSGGDFHLKNNY